MMRIALWLAVFMVVILASIVANGAPPPGVHLDPEISDWFKSLQNQTTGAFCCNTTDGHVLGDGEWHTTDLGYEVKDGGTWIAVPPEAVLQRSYNPTGGAVVFIWHGSVLCFVRPTES